VGTPLSLSFAALSGFLDRVLLCCTFASLGYAASSSLAVPLESLAHTPLCSFPPLHPHQLIFSLF